MSFLLEYYPPFLQLVSKPELKKELMQFGISKKSVPVKIPMAEAKKNTTDLILFRNTFPNITTTQMVKFGKKTIEEDRGVWCGWKKGNEFKVIKPKETGGRELENLYNCDFAYKIPIERKEELRRNFKQEHPDYKERNTEVIGNKKLLDKVKSNREKSEAERLKIEKRIKFKDINKYIKKLLDLQMDLWAKNYDKWIESVKSNTNDANLNIYAINYDIKNALRDVQRMKQHIGKDSYEDYKKRVEDVLSEYKKGEL